MKVIISGSPEEITDLVLALRDQLEKQIKLEQDVKDLQKYLLNTRAEMFGEIAKS